MTILYHYLLMSQKDLLQNQGIEEILRERANYYNIRKKPRDFWILISPKFIYSSKIIEDLRNSNFYKYKKNLITSSFLKNIKNEFYGAIISADKTFIDWMQVRLGGFENINDKNFGKNENQIRYDGIRGEIYNTLEAFNNYIHPDILLSQNEQFLKLHYNLISKELI